MLKVVKHTDIDPLKWEEYVENHRFGTIFHSTHFFSIYKQIPGYRPFALFCVTGTGEITGLIVAYYHNVTQGVLAPVSRRIVLMNSPIADDTVSMYLLLVSLKRMASFKAIYIEIRNHYDAKSFEDVYQKAGYIAEKHLNILVDLSKEEEKLWTDVGSSRKREIKQANKVGFEFVHDNDKVQTDLYPILQGIYGRAKLPLPPKLYFENIFQMPKTNYEVMGLQLEDEVIGALLVLKHKGTVYGLYGGSREKYYKQRPNDLLFWSTLLWAKKNGYSTFDWLGAGHPDKPYGVRDWKKQFGGYFVCYGRYYYYPSKLLYNTAEKAFQVYRHRLGKK